MFENYELEIWKGTDTSMKIQKSIFLISYIIYLSVMMVYVMISNESAMIDTVIFSVTIASAFFALSDLIYTKIEIDKREADEEFNLYFLYKYASKIYMQEIEDKYAEQTEEYLSNLEKILGEEKLEKVFQSKLTKNEKTMCLNKVNDIKLKQFLNALIEDREELDSLYEDNENSIDDTLEEKKRRERRYFMLPDIFMIIGLVSLLMILTLRIEPLTKISNVCTIGAFLLVILNLTIKEYYKSDSIRKLATNRRKIIKNMIEDFQKTAR